MEMKSRTDAVLGVVIATAGITLFFWVIPFEINDAGAYGLPPSFVPKLLAGLMFLLGSLMAARNCRAFLPVSRRDGQSRERAALTWSNMGHLCIVVGTCAAMLWTMGEVGGLSQVPYAGFWVAVPPAVVVFTLIHGQVRLRTLFINAVATPASIYAMSWFVFHIPMP
ncbi:tripartite tricarboxylate transporter TctB family protein [Aestuariispira ectoiniformans]|uniref:tripartite tricarboxylate transporter TctB family protein n=1 Tax=Aestuariispira ectoiniformans TaxID=2775080 RepID=UPI00223AB3FF|nr:tripartite tricarboxylate transporter TctB family protein [Aestuariispira ectoiniformans]